MPGGGKIGKGNTPVGKFLVDVGLVAETVNPIRRFGEIPFVILAFVVERDFRVESKKRRKEVRGIGTRGRIAGFGDKGWHIPSRDGFRSTVVEEDKILWRARRVEGNIHNGAGTCDGLIAGAGFLDPSAGRVRFTDDGGVPAMERNEEAAVIDDCRIDRGR